MSKMFALELEGSIVATNNTIQDALVAAISRKLQFTHPLLQSVVGLRETFENGSRVRRSTSNVITCSVGIDDGELIFVRDICLRLFQH